MRSAGASSLRVSRRELRVGLALLWLSAAALQAQPVMFTHGLTRGVLRPAAAGQPTAVAVVIRLAAAIVAAHPAATNAVFAAVQALLGAALLRERSARPALIASAAWGVGVWALGEGLGGLLTGKASVFTGSPGPALLYAILAAVAWPGRRNRQAREPLPPWTPVAWTAVWVLIVIFGPWPGQSAGSLLRGQLTASAAELPASLASALKVAASTANHHPIPPIIALVLAEAFIALGALAMGRMRNAAVATGAALALLAWLTQAFGGVASGHATDVGSGPPLILLALAVWATPPRPPLPRRRSITYSADTELLSS